MSLLPRYCLFLSFAGMFAATLAAGCGDEDGDAPAEVATAELRLEATSSLGTGALEFEDSSGTRFTLTALRVGVEEIELDLPVNSNCGDLRGDFAPPVECDDEGIFGGEDQVKFDGPFVFDVLEGTSIPNISGLKIPAVNYQEVDLEVDTARAEDRNVSLEDEIIDRTVVAYADFEIENQKRELKLDFSFKTEAKAGSENPANMDLAQGDTLVIALDIADWLEDIPLTHCLSLGELKARDGLVVLDDEAVGACQDAESEFESNFKRSLQVRIERADAAGAR